MFLLNEQPLATQALMTYQSLGIFPFLSLNPEKVVSYPRQSSGMRVEVDAEQVVYSIFFYHWQIWTVKSLYKLLKAYPR